jgi:hypothetical protein
VIALIFAAPTATGFSVSEITSDTIRSLTREVRKLSLVPKLAPAPRSADGMLTVAQFCADRGIGLAVSDMSRIGRRAAALSRKGGMLIGRATDPAFGEVNSYDPAMLAKAFDQIDAETP